MAASIAQCCRSLKSCNFQNANNKFELFSISYRCCSNHKSQPEIKPPGRIKAFIVKKYFNYLTKFDTKFEKTYPQIYKVYRLFKDGVRDFFIDSKMYYTVATGIWSGGPLNSFTRKELLSYQQMPNDMIRSAPILISVPLPLVPYALFPIARMNKMHRVFLSLVMSYFHGAISVLLMYRLVRTNPPTGGTANTPAGGMAKPLPWTFLALLYLYCTVVVRCLNRMVYHRRSYPWWLCEMFTLGVDLAFASTTSAIIVSVRMKHPPSAHYIYDVIFGAIIALCHVIEVRRAP